MAKIVQKCCEFYNTFAPLWYVRSGYVVITNGKLSRAGDYSYRWSKSSYTDGTRAYYLYFENFTVYPSYYSNRYYGFSLRCLHQP